MVFDFIAKIILADARDTSCDEFMSYNCCLLFLSFRVLNLWKNHNVVTPGCLQPALKASVVYQHDLCICSFYHVLFFWFLSHCMIFVYKNFVYFSFFFFFFLFFGSRRSRLKVCNLALVANSYCLKKQ